MAGVYFIRDWDQHFEVSQSKRADRLRWVAVPNRHDGKSFRRLMRMADGLAIYGCFHLIIQVASKCPIRGRLEDSDGPLSASDISDKTGAPVELIQRALDVCVSREIGWIGRSDATPSPLRDDSESTPSLAPPTRQDNTRQNETGQDETKQDDAARGTGDGQPLRQPRSRSNFDPLTVALPAELDTPLFRESWGKWVVFRQKKRKPISEDAAREQISELTRYGPAVAAEAIRQSIKSDWQGLFPEKIYVNGNGPRARDVSGGPAANFAAGSVERGGKDPNF